MYNCLCYKCSDGKQKMFVSKASNLTPVKNTKFFFKNKMGLN